MCLNDTLDHKARPEYVWHETDIEENALKYNRIRTKNQRLFPTFPKTSKIKLKTSFLCTHKQIT